MWMGFTKCMWTVNRQLVLKQTLSVFRACTKGCSSTVLWFILCLPRVHGRIVKSTKTVGELYANGLVRKCVLSFTVTVYYPHLFAMVLCYSVTLSLQTLRFLCSLGSTWRVPILPRMYLWTNSDGSSDTLLAMDQHLHDSTAYCKVQDLLAINVSDFPLFWISRTSTVRY